MLQGIHLTLMMGPVVPVPVPQFVIDALASIEVTMRTNGPSGFKLTFNLPKRSPLQTFFLLSSGAIPPFLRTLIVVTMNGTPQVLMDGLVTRQSATPGNEPGQTTITLMGDDLTAAMDLISFDGLLYPGMMAEARVALMIAKYAMFGMIPLVIPSLGLDVPNPIERYPTHQGTDLNYIKLLAREVGHIFYIDPGPVPGTNTAYWGPPIKLGIPQPALSADMDAHTNVNDLNFSINTVSSVLPIVYIHEPFTKATIPVLIPNINPLQPPLGAIPPIPQRIEFMKETAKLSFPKALARGLAKASEAGDMVSGSGSLDVLRYGHILKARGLVGVRGVGTAFDGLYFVESVTSTLKRGEFKQSFELSRNGLVSITPRVPV